MTGTPSLSKLQFQNWLMNDFHRGKQINYFNNLNIYQESALEVLLNSLSLIKSLLIDKWSPLQVDELGLSDKPSEYGNLIRLVGKITTTTKNPKNQESCQRELFQANYQVKALTRGKSLTSLMRVCKLCHNMFSSV